MVAKLPLSGFSRGSGSPLDCHILGHAGSPDRCKHGSRAARYRRCPIDPLSPVQNWANVRAHSSKSNPTVELRSAAERKVREVRFIRTSPALFGLCLSGRNLSGERAMNEDLLYLNRRVSEERTAAFRSPNRQVADIHRELADAYEFRVFLLTKMPAFDGTEQMIVRAE
jgi:hypothetical protein